MPIELNETPSVTFTYKKRVQPISIELDFDALTWEDNIHFALIQEKIEKEEITQEESMGALTSLLEKLTGQDVKKLPMSVVKAILEEFHRLSELGDSERKN